MMNRHLILLLIAFALMQMGINAQTYFPINGQNWETKTFAEAGWCSDSLDALIDFLDQEDTKAFIVLHDGKIIVEHYFDTFTADSLWYWASAGKTLTSSMVGIAEQDFNLNLQASTSTYLGQGWTSLTQQQEDAITVWNQLTMTTGLNDAVLDDDCTLPACLEYVADPGTRWAYHNAPYTLLDGVLQNVSGLTLNQLFAQKIGLPCGISGLYFPSGPYNQTFVSTPRNMAKFGLLLQSQGNWNGTEIIPSNYFQSMITPSQTINPAYGYLTWLNGSSSFMIPETQIQFPGMLAPSAPEDAYAGLGKNGQVVCAAPSKNVSFVRMGNGNNELVSVTMLEDIWRKMKWFFCTSGMEDNEQPMVVIKNNGFRPELIFNQSCEFEIWNTNGQRIQSPINLMESGIYFLHCFNNQHREIYKLLVGEN
jgi:CubicO group peptidase (beta-lactamase class C family)